MAMADVTFTVLSARDATDDVDQWSDATLGESHEHGSRRPPPLPCDGRCYCCNAAVSGWGYCDGPDSSSSLVMWMWPHEIAIQCRSGLWLVVDNSSVDSVHRGSNGIGEFQINIVTSANAMISSTSLRVVKIRVLMVVLLLIGVIVGLANSVGAKVAL